MSASTPIEPADLWSKIRDFPLDEAGAAFPFSARLARENGWSDRYTTRVIQEYRRFLFLAATAGHPVTPPVAVDQAWHLHLLYTRSYWDHLCGQVLRRPLHHEPTRGGGGEAKKYTDWYRWTLDSYERTFGRAPPREIWPEAGDRFSPRGRIRQVSDRTHWVIRKPGPRRGSAALLTILGVSAVPSCAGGPGGPGWALLLGAVLIAGLIIAVLGGGPGGPCDASPSRDKSGNKRASKHQFCSESGCEGCDVSSSGCGGGSDGCGDGCGGCGD